VTTQPANHGSLINHFNMYNLINTLDSSIISTHSTLIDAVTALLLPTTPFGAEVVNGDGSDVDIDDLLGAEHIVRNRMALA
jgi:hypothetical protein